MSGDHFQKVSKENRFYFSLGRRPQHGRSEKMSKKHVFALRGYVGVIGKVTKKNDFLLKLSGYDLNPFEIIS